MIAELGRFVIREIHPWESPGVFRMTGDPETMRYMGFRVHTSELDAAYLIELYRGNTSQRWLAIADKAAPADMLGIVGLEVRGHQATLTIMFRKDWKARGAGREFSVPFVQWIFTHPNIWRVWAYCHVNNIAVQRVLSRMGAECEGRLRRFEYFPNISDEPQDVYVYAIVRD